MDERGQGDAAGELARAHRARWMNWAIPLAIVALVFGGAVLYAALGKEGRAFGEPCERSSDCGGRGATCLVAVEASICTRHCEQPGDCPAGWTCQLSDILNARGDQTGTMIQACVRER
jgi:hypothetical protein